MAEKKKRKKASSEEVVKKILIFITLGIILFWIFLNLVYGFDTLVNVIGVILIAIFWLTPFKKIFVIAYEQQEIYGESEKYVVENLYHEYYREVRPLDGNAMIEWLMSKGTFKARILDEDKVTIVFILNDLNDMPFTYETITRERFMEWYRVCDKENLSHV